VLFRSIHADGLLKDEEIYNIFDTGKLLKRPVGVVVNQTSGLAGIAHWINGDFGLEGGKRLDKRDERVVKIKDWVDGQYNGGRVTSIGENELEEAIREIAPDIFDLVL
jgi:isopropylmalate/homocitrate/citramalate synthase